MFSAMGLLGLEHVGFELHVDLLDAQRAATFDHMLSHFGNRLAGAFPAEILIPVAAVLRGKFDFAIMPQRLGINGGAVKIAEYGFQQHVCSLLWKNENYASSTPKQLDSISARRIRFGAHSARNSKCAQRYPHRIIDLDPDAESGS